MVKQFIMLVLTEQTEGGNYHLLEIQLKLTFQNVNTVIDTLKIYKATSRYVWAR